MRFLPRPRALLSPALAAALAGACLALPAHAQQTPPQPSLGDLLASIPSGTGYAAWDLCSRAKIGRAHV